jgi:conjugative transfer signal peptidase TraF
MKLITGGTMKRRVSLCKIAIFTIPCLSALLLAFQSGSMPRGISKNKSRISLNESARGKTVVFCPPDTEIFRRARDKGILQPGACEGSYTPLQGEVVGLPGDVIEYTDSFSVNGGTLPHSAIQLLDLGTALPLFRRLVLPEGQFWVMDSNSSFSFDSRYFGPVSEKTILSLPEQFIVSQYRADSGKPALPASLD